MGAEGQKAVKRARLKEKAERQSQNSKKQDDDGGASGEEKGGARKSRASTAGADGIEEPVTAGGKKKRFHPFGWGAKKTRHAAAGQQNTVEFDKGRSRQGQRGGAKHKGDKKNGRMSVMDKFRQSQAGK